VRYLIKFFFINLFFLHNLICVEKQNIALCAVATGKYACFVKGFVESARKNFLPEHNVKYFIFTDQVLSVEGDDIVTIRWPHKKWPFSALMRFKAYHDAAYLFNSMDYVFACDIDASFVDIVDDHILGQSVGVLHPKYYNKDLIKTGLINNLIEKNSKSSIYLRLKKANNQYFSGRFYGGRTAFFKKLVSECYNTVMRDLMSGIVATWHDEAHLNYFFLNNPPQLKLSPSYCYTAGAESGLVYKQIKMENPIIKMIDKNQLRMRSRELFVGDREFVILIPSYNNIKYYQANLNSVYNQNYKKYRVIYIDDNSPDGTGEAVCQCIKDLGKENITTIVKNKDRKLAMANIYNNIHKYCMDHEIVVMLDGDDELSGPDVLERLNDEYKKSDIWFTYGNCWFSAIKRTCPWSSAIGDKEVELNRFREWKGAATHLRTFYAWLFKKIKQTDLMLHGEFFKMTYDVAMFTPMLEMAGYHHKFIEDVLYLYNDENPLNDHKINGKLQAELNKYIRNKLTRYQPVTKLELFDKILMNQSEKNELLTIEVAAILNDFIAGITNVYQEAEVFDILDKVACLRNDSVERLNLKSVAVLREYAYLSNYLARQEEKDNENQNYSVNFMFKYNSSFTR
jgi:glycosyltransferase involved in cell wall biosynthesis